MNDNTQNTEAPAMLRTDKNQDAEGPLEHLLMLIKVAAIALCVGFCLHLGEYTAEQIWPTPPIVIKTQD